jgi:hypothetical protein
MQVENGVRTYIYMSLSMGYIHDTMDVPMGKVKDVTWMNERGGGVDWNNSCPKFQNSVA